MQVCNNVPEVVYQNTWLGVTSALSSSSVYTLPSTGLYRMTMGAKASLAAGPPYNDIGVTPAANTTTTNASVSLNNLQGGTVTKYDQATLSFYGVSGESVDFGISVAGSGTFSVDVYFTIEQLQ